VKPTIRESCILNTVINQVCEGMKVGLGELNLLFQGFFYFSFCTELDQRLRVGTTECNIIYFFEGPGILTHLRTWPVGALFSLNVKVCLKHGRIIRILILVGH